MTELSPAAQSVWDAAWANTPVQCGDIEGTRRAQVAAALRAAVDQAVPVTQESVEDSLTELTELDDAPLSEEETAVLRLSIALCTERDALIRSRFFAIAAELENGGAQ